LSLSPCLPESRVVPGRYPYSEGDPICNRSTFSSFSVSDSSSNSWTSDHVFILSTSVFPVIFVRL
ncbi:hypothetical protein CSUI_009740, partial [Cystoisospora suis]